MNTSPLGGALRNIRLKQRWRTLGRMARVTALSMEYLSKIERGEACPQWNTLVTVVAGYWLVARTDAEDDTALVELCQATAATLMRDVRARAKEIDR